MALCTSLALKMMLVVWPASLVAACGFQRCKVHVFSLLGMTGRPLACFKTSWFGHCGVCLAHAPSVLVTDRKWPSPATLYGNFSSTIHCDNLRGANKDLKHATSASLRLHHQLPTMSAADPTAMPACAALVEEQDQPLAIASIFIILVVSYISFMLPGFISRHRHPSIQVG